MQKHVNLVDLVKSFPTNIFLQNLASIQKRTRTTQFNHLTEKSERGSISNRSTKARTRLGPEGSCSAGTARPRATVSATPFVAEIRRKPAEIRPRFPIPGGSVYLKIHNSSVRVGLFSKFLIYFPFFRPAPPISQQFFKLNFPQLH